MTWSATALSAESGGLGGRRRSRKRRPISALWLAIPLVLLVANRGDTRDTSTYIDIFSATTEFPTWPMEYYQTYGVEWGFGILSWLVRSLHLGATSLFAVVSAATFFFISRAARLLDLSFYEVMPFYLGSFFLTQQLMQVRQGLGVALAFWVVVRFAKSQNLRLLLLGAVAASLAHIVALVPPVAALLAQLRTSPRRWRIALWALALMVVGFVIARVATGLDAFQVLERLTLYATDDEYGSARSIFDLANVRAAAMLAVFVFACRSRTLAHSHPYQLLLGLYALHLGLRLGFIDFQILSGRLATALGFAEVFLLPMALRTAVASVRTRALISSVYLAIQLAATLTLQTPFLIDDYVAPLHADYPAG